MNEYRIGGNSDLNEGGGWLKIKTRKEGSQILIEFYKGDDGFWDKTPILTFDSHWIKEIIFALDNLIR